MGKPKVARSFLEQLADYESPAPKDIDPEGDFEKHEGDSASSADEDGLVTNAGREHYSDVEKSKLRPFDSVEMGPQYTGASVSRAGIKYGNPDNDFGEPFGNLETDDEVERETSGQDEEEEQEALEPFENDGDDDEDDEGDDDDEDEDEDRELPETFLHSPITSQEEEEKGHHNEEEEEGEDEEEDSDNGLSSDNGSHPQDSTDRAAVRRMMAEEQKSVAASLSAVAKADITKGIAIKQQHSAFDSLLNTRIKLQKALIASNSMAMVHAPPSSKSDSVSLECASASRAAEAAALNLWNSLSSLRTSLRPSPETRKRPASATAESSSQSLWHQCVDMENNALANRRTTLTKWSQRTNPSGSLRSQNQFSQASAQAPLTSVLDQHLAGESMERAIKRTRVARSCAPIQAGSKPSIEDERVYDDADFYTLLLRELVDRRMANTQTSSGPLTPHVASILPSRAELKVKKTVDTKASKGRKMRYTVHEKLQNFMVAGR